jgi:hypothetical protein
MAVKLSTPKMDFLSKVLVKHPGAWGKAVMLDNSGVEFAIELLTIKAMVAGQAYSVLLKCSTTKMMKEPDAPESELALLHLVNFLDNLYAKVLPNTPVTEASPAALPQGVPSVVGGIGVFAPVSNSSVPVQSIAPVPSTPVPAAPAAPKLKPGVIKLRDAEALGQQVSGSSSGSIYRVVAASDTVKVACRLASQGISLRIEGKNMTPEELAKIKQAGMPWHGDVDSYGSLHLQDVGDIPTAAVLGSFLHRLGIKFDRVIQPGDAVVA